MPQSLIQAMLADTPSALWMFDEPQGAAVARDISGNARHLDYYGSPSMRSAVAIAGDDMKVWNPALNGADYASFQSSAYVSAVNPGSGDFLYTCWVKGSTVNPTATTFSTLFNLDNNDSGNGIDIYLVDTWTGANSGSLRIWYGGSVLNSTVAQQGSSVFDGRSHLLWFEKRSGTLSIYYDGVLCTSGGVGTPNVGGTTWVQVGNSYAQGDPYRHHNPISYVGIWANTTIPAVARQAVYLAEARRAGVTF